MLYHIPPDSLNSACKGGQLVFCWVAETGKSTVTDGLCLELEAKNPKCVCARINYEKNADLMKNLAYRYGDYCFLYENGDPKWEHYQRSKELIAEKMKMAKDKRKDPKLPSGPLELPSKSRKREGERFF